MRDVLGETAFDISCAAHVAVFGSHAKIVRKLLQAIGSLRDPAPSRRQVHLSRAGCTFLAGRLLAAVRVAGLRAETLALAGLLHHAGQQGQLGPALVLPDFKPVVAAALRLARTSLPGDAVLSVLLDTPGGQQAAEVEAALLPPARQLAGSHGAMTSSSPPPTRLELEAALDRALEAAERARAASEGEQKMRAASRALGARYMSPEERQREAVDMDEQLEAMEAGRAGGSAVGEEKRVQARMARMVGFCAGGEFFSRSRLDGLRAAREVERATQEAARMRAERRQNRAASAASRASYKSAGGRSDATAGGGTTPGAVGAG